jgi:hypothetical protein
MVYSLNVKVVKKHKLRSIIKIIRIKNGGGVKNKIDLDIIKTKSIITFLGGCENH